MKKKRERPTTGNAAVILRWLEGNPDGYRSGEIAEALDMTTNEASSYLHVLHTRGWTHRIGRKNLYVHFPVDTSPITHVLQLLESSPLTLGALLELLKDFSRTTLEQTVDYLLEAKEVKYSRGRLVLYSYREQAQTPRPKEQEEPETQPPKAEQPTNGAPSVTTLERVEVFTTDGVRHVFAEDRTYLGRLVR